MITYEYERFLPKIKSLNYMAAVISLQKAKKQQAQDALFISKNGNILEGTTVNFFGILDGKLVNNSKRKVIINKKILHSILPKMIYYMELQEIFLLK